jgi:hypothetical protein
MVPDLNLTSRVSGAIKRGLVMFAVGRSTRKLSVSISVD